MPYVSNICIFFHFLQIPCLSKTFAFCIQNAMWWMHILLSTYIKTFVLLTDKTEDETVTITFGYIMPTMLALLFISVACYCVHKYIHIHKQKHPTNLVSVFYCRRSLPTLALTAELCVFQGSKQAWRKLWLALSKSSSCPWDQEKKTTWRVIKSKKNRVITHICNDQNRAVGLGRVIALSKVWGALGKVCQDARTP